VCVAAGECCARIRAACSSIDSTTSIAQTGAGAPVEAGTVREVSDMEKLCELGFDEFPTTRVAEFLEGEKQCVCMLVLLHSAVCVFVCVCVCAYVLVLLTFSCVCLCVCATPFVSVWPLVCMPACDPICK